MSRKDEEPSQFPQGFLVFPCVVSLSSHSNPHPPSAPFILCCSSRRRVVRRTCILMKGFVVFCCCVVMRVLGLHEIKPCVVAPAQNKKQTSFQRKRTRVSKRVYHSDARALGTVMLALGTVRVARCGL